MTELRIAKIIHNTEVEGPGKRTAIWFQGCSIKCPGCINKELQDPEGGNIYTPEEIYEAIKASGDTKLTILGGEPLDQVNQLMSLMHYLKCRMPELTTMLFTGYERDKAKEKLYIGWKAFDVIITGPYIKSLPDSRKWIGSSNQVINYISTAARDWASLHRWPKKPFKEVEFSYDDYGAYENGL